MNWLKQQLYGSASLSIRVKHSVGLLVGYGLIGLGIALLF